MDRPVVSDVAEEVYVALGANTRGDAGSWALLRFVDTLARPLQVIQDLSGDTEDGPGWSGLMDLTRCPPGFLGYLAQFVGVQTAPGLTDAAQRDRIANAEGWRRGTPASIVAAARQWLTGAQHLSIIERPDGEAYRLKLAFYQTEVIDEDQLRRAINAAVPAGIIADIGILPGWSYADLAAAYAGQTYADLAADYAGQSYAYLGSVVP